MSHLCLAVLLLVLASAGCIGHKGWPYAFSANDVAKLDPATTTMLSARELSDNEIASLSKLPHLRYLDFFRGKADVDAVITDRGLQALSELDLPELNWVVLGFCPHITDAGLVYVARIGTIHRLALMGSAGITDAGLTPLTTMGLEYLDLRMCPGITDKSVATLSNMRSLTGLMIGGCDNLSPTARQAIRQALPQCRVDDDDYNAHQSLEGYESAWVKAHYDEEMQKRDRAQGNQGSK